MATNLKIKSSPFLIVTRFLTLILTLTTIICFLLSFVDMRTEKQKELDRKALISTTAFSCSVEAVKYAKAHASFDVETIKSVSYLPYQKGYVLISYENSNGIETEMTYITTDKMGYLGEHLYLDAVIMSSVMPTKIQSTEYKGINLKILLEEAKYGDNNL